MSRTTHHRIQKHAHCGHDFGARYKCNKGYVNNYGPYGRKRARSERRMQEKKIIKDELRFIP